MRDEIELSLQVLDKYSEEIARLRQQVAELQAWKDAVPVNAISRYYYGTMQIDGVYSDDEYNSDSSSIEIWMDGMTD